MQHRQVFLSLHALTEWGMFGAVSSLKYIASQATCTRPTELPDRTLGGFTHKAPFAQLPLPETATVSSEPSCISAILAVWDIQSSSSSWTMPFDEAETGMFPKAPWGPITAFCPRTTATIV